MQPTFIKTIWRPIAELKANSKQNFEVTKFEDLKLLAETFEVDIVLFDDQKYYFYTEYQDLYYWFITVKP